MKHEYLILILKAGETTALIAEKWRVLDRALERKQALQSDNPNATVMLVTVLD